MRLVAAGATLNALSVNLEFLQPLIGFFQAIATLEEPPWAVILNGFDPELPPATHDPESNHLGYMGSTTSWASERCTIAATVHG
jgi:hypothetical protein